MSAEEARLIRARRQSAAARARLTGTLVELQHRLRPKVLIEEALEDLREKASEAVHDAIDTARDRPFTTAAVIVAIFAWLFRDRLVEAIEDLIARVRATDAQN